MNLFYVQFTLKHRFVLPVTPAEFTAWQADADQLGLASCVLDVGDSAQVLVTAFVPLTPDHIATAVNMVTDFAADDPFFYPLEAVS